MERWQIRLPWDMHHHGREGDLLPIILSILVQKFAGATLMPNLREALVTPELLQKYRNTVRKILLEMESDFRPIFTFQTTETTTAKTVREMLVEGAMAGKVYPQNVTTNSENGVLNYEKIYPALEAKEELGMLALLHGESPDPTVDVEDREVEFLKVLDEIIKRYPKLKIVFEHITTAAAVRWVLNAPDNVAATITPHHLQITSTDVRGGKFKPHLFCKPEAKRFADRTALRLAAVSGNPKFFAGTDSALHRRSVKECEECCAGVFCLPNAIETYATVFDEMTSRDKLDDFLSGFGPAFYGLQPSSETIEIIEDWWIVRPIPFGDDAFIPYRSGDAMRFRAIR